MINMKAKMLIRVLIVEDSLFFAKVMQRKLSSDKNIEVVGIATDAYDARDQIIKYNPDVMTLDVEMPRMTGIQFLKKLMPQYPIPIVVVSALDDKVFDALNAGAVDFVNKPNLELTMEDFIDELVDKIKVASTVNVSHHKKNVNKYVNRKSIKKSEKFNVIAIGSSTGGTVALKEVLSKFTTDVPGIVIAQHMPPVFTKMYAERLNRELVLDIKEASDGDIISSGKVLLAPGNYHIRVVKSGSKFKVALEKGNAKNKVNGHCPSVDVLFDSVATEVKGEAVGIILTGMGRDGAKGLKRMRKSGAVTIGQDKETSVVYGMPKEAKKINALDYQMPLENIAEKVISVIEKS